LASKVAKSAYKTKKNVCHNNSIWVSKNGKREKVTEKKLWGLELLPTVLKDEKQQNSFTFM
jgi:hypothetical protein